LLWDPDLPGFGLKVTAGGRKIYVLQYRYQGRQRRYSIGLHGPLTPAEARQEAVRLLGEVAKGADPAAAKQAGRQAPTMAELARRYLEEHGAKKRASSLRHDRANLRNHVLPALGSKQVRAVTRADVARLHHQLRMTPTQANRVLALLSKVFSLAELWGLRPDGSNPCRLVQKFRETKRERFLSSEELGRLGAVLSETEAEGSELPSVVVALRLLIFLGARKSEVLGLKWSDLNLERGVIHLADSKTGPKEIYLNQAAAEILAAAPKQEGNDFVCWGLKPGQPLVGLHRPWARIRKRAELGDCRLHDLRHSHASIAAGAGLSLPLIGRLLGHSQAQTTQRYSHLADDPVRAAAELVGRKLAEAMNKRPTAKVVPMRPKK